jgi:hypothetical protein
MYLIAFPLLLVPFALYNMVAFLLNLPFGDILFSIPLLAGRSLPVSTGDAIVLLGILFLYLEFLKVMRLSRRPMMDHLLSLVLFGAMAFELLAVPKAATPTFLMLLGLSLIDAIGGLSLAPRRLRSVPAAAMDRYPSDDDY